METVDQDWDTMMQKASDIQQRYYENLSDWHVFSPSNYKLLYCFIRCVMYGIEDLDDNFMDKNVNITEMFKPNSEIDNVVSKIHDIIFEHSIDQRNGNIHVGIIYNIIFRTKNKKENANKMKCDDGNQYVCPVPVPVFKIRKYFTKSGTKGRKQSGENHKQTEDTYTYEIWYIDMNQRVYKNWDHYLTTNILPKCTMVFPKNGKYQANHMLSTTGQLVLLGSCNSPATKLKNEIVSNIDIASFVLTVGAAGLIAAGALPAAVTAGVALGMSAVTGAIAIGKSSNTLVDRSEHKQSISIKNKAALSCWVGIATNVTTIAVTGGTLALVKNIKNGKNIGKVCEVAYNAATIGNVGLNVTSAVIHGYNLYEKYKEEKTLTVADIAFFLTHLLLCGNYVVNVRFAKSIIENTQGKIINKYETELRSERFVQEYENIKQNAAANNVDKIAENSEIIRHVKQFDFKSSEMLSVVNSIHSMSFQFTAWEIELNGLLLIDPMLCAVNNFGLNVLSRNDGPVSIGQEFKNKLGNLLESINSDLYNFTKRRFTEADFKFIILDLWNINNASSIFYKCVKMAMEICLNSDQDSVHIINIVKFVWKYVKCNVIHCIQRKCLTIENEMISNLLMSVVTNIHDNLELLIEKFINALEIDAKNHDLSI